MVVRPVQWNATSVLVNGSPPKDNCVLHTKRLKACTRVITGIPLLHLHVFFVLCQVCERSSCAVQVLPVGVNLLDRFLSIKKTEPDCLLLVSAACLLTASKLLQALPLRTRLLCRSAFHVFSSKELRVSPFRLAEREYLWVNCQFPQEGLNCLVLVFQRTRTTAREEDSSGDDIMQSQSLMHAYGDIFCHFVALFLTFAQAPVLYLQAQF